MPFCVNCGAQNPDGARFCQSCGKPVTQTVSSAQPPPAPAPQAFHPFVASSEAPGSARMLVLAGAGIYLVAAVLSLMGGDMLNLFFSALLAAGVYMAVYTPLQKGDLAAAKKGALTAGVVCLAFMFFGLIQGSFVGVLFNAAAAACVGLAWNAIKG